MTIAEQIYEIVKSLPENQASEVLTFAEFVQAKHLKDKQSTNIVDSASWAELISSLTGVWQKDFPTLEEIRAELE